MTYTYEDFLKIIETLRSENGCPWDKVQTHESLKPCMVEEAAEVLAAIRIYDKTGDYENLREELGDVLLQVVMHAQIAKEEGIFTMEEVVNEVAEKMIRRHPHVFKDVEDKDPEKALATWEEAKKKEKEGKKQVATPLKEIPPELPSLSRATKVLKKIDKLYEPQKGYDDTILALKAAVEKLEQVSLEDEEKQLEDSIGDILLQVSNLARIKKISADQILMNLVDDMIDKYEH